MADPTGTIPMLIIAGIAFVPVEPMIPAEMDPNQNCEQVIARMAPAFRPDADVKMPCVLVPEPCSADRRSKNRCSKPGDFWVR